MTEIILATSNPHKLEEIKDIAKNIKFKLNLVGDNFNPDETGRTFRENAYIKAYEAAKLTGKIALADDSGLCIDALSGAPGIYSARNSDRCVRTGFPPGGEAAPPAPSACRDAEKSSGPRTRWDRPWNKCRKRKPQ